MSKILTAEELLRQNVEGKKINYDNWIKQVPPIVFEFAKEFAKLHVQEALKQVSEKGQANNGGTYHNGEHLVSLSASIDKKSILNAYPLENIK